MTNYAMYLQPELAVSYCNIVSVTVEDRLGSHEMRNAVGAFWPFLCDPDRKLLHELEMVDTSEHRFGLVYVPYSFVLDGDRTIYKVYNGWWFLGKPTVEELRMDFRALMSKRPDWEYTADWKPVRETGLKPEK